MSGTVPESKLVAFKERYREREEESKGQEV